jgi:hypothetical protein
LNEVRSLLQVSNLKESEIPKLVKVLDKYKVILQKEDIILSYQRNDASFAQDRIQWNIFFKGKYTRRVKPNKFVYHFSSGDESIKNDILKNGLIPYKQQDSQTWKNVGLEYPNSVFAVNNDTLSWSTGHIFKIDTEGLPNKWWEDLNFKVGNTDLIMTFEPIPPSHIELLNSEEEIQRRNKKIKIRIDRLQEVDKEFDELIKSIDLEGLKNKIELHKKDLSGQNGDSWSPISIDKLLMKSSKFGSIDIVKFLVSKYNPDIRLINSMIRLSEKYKNTEVLNYLKSFIR